MSGDLFTGVEYVVVGPNYWGKGATLDVAKKNFRKEGGQLKDGYLIFEFPPETEFMGVDDFGTVHWKSRPASIPRTPEESRYCIHDNEVWFGHECGMCEDSEDGYVWRPVPPTKRLVKGTMTK